FDQRASGSHIPVHEDAEREFQVFNDALVKCLKFSRSIFRKLILVLDLLIGKLNQIFVNDVSDMFQVNRKRDYFSSAPSVTLIKALTGYLGPVQLDRLVQPWRRCCERR